jgi:hypothetical protein
VSGAGKGAGLGWAESLGKQLAEDTYANTRANGRRPPKVSQKARRASALRGSKHGGANTVEKLARLLGNPDEEG